MTITKGHPTKRGELMRKGQAAMEFLMTYGWAILVVLVAIGALAYFGVLNPGQFLPRQCLIGPGFSCTDFSVVADGSWTVIVRNGVGETVTVVDLDLSGITPGGAGAGSCAPASVSAGQTTTCTGAAGSVTAGTAGDRVQATLNFDYTGSGGLAHTLSGTLTTEME